MDPAPKPTQPTVLFWLGLLLVVGAAHACIAWAGWTQPPLADDWGNLQVAHLSESWKLGDILSFLFWPPLSSHETNYYRPLVFLSFVFDWNVFGRDFFGWHLTSSAMFAITGWGVGWIAWLLLRCKHAAVFAALVFTLYPGHTEVTHWVADRTSIVAGLFAVFTLVCMFASRRGLKPGDHASLSSLQTTGRWIAWFGAHLCFAAALCSKESAWLLPPVVLAALWFFPNDPTSGLVQRLTRTIVAFSGFALLTVSYFALRKRAFGTWEATFSPSNEASLGGVQWNSGFFQTLFAPVHEAYLSAGVRWWMLGVFAMVAIACVVGLFSRATSPRLRPAMLWSLVWLLGGSLALMQTLFDARVLGNGRNVFELVVPVAVLFGASAGMLCARVAAKPAWLALAALLLAAGYCQMRNRTSWVEAGLLASRMRSEARDLVAQEQDDRPLWILGLPLLHEGAFFKLLPDSPSHPPWGPPLGPAGEAGRIVTWRAKDTGSALAAAGHPQTEATGPRLMRFDRTTGSLAPPATPTPTETPVVSWAWIGTPSAWPGDTLKINVAFEAAATPDPTRIELHRNGERLAAVTADASPATLELQIPPDTEPGPVTVIATRAGGPPETLGVVEVIARSVRPD